MQFIYKLPEIKNTLENDMRFIRKIDQSKKCSDSNKENWLTKLQQILVERSK